MCAYLSVCQHFHVLNHIVCFRLLLVVRHCVVKSVITTLYTFTLRVRFQSAENCPEFIAISLMSSCFGTRWKNKRR